MTALGRLRAFVRDLFTIGRCDDAPLSRLDRLDGLRD